MKSSRRKLEDAIVKLCEATPEEMKQLYEFDSRGFIEAIYFDVFL
jgi:hypothetical protein